MPAQMWQGIVIYEEGCGEIIRPIEHELEKQHCEQWMSQETQCARACVRARGRVRACVRVAACVDECL